MQAAQATMEHLNAVKQEVNFIEHLKGFWVWKNNTIQSENGLKLTAITLTIYDTLFEKWNNAGFPKMLEIHREEIMRLARCGSAVTYAKAMRNLHDLGVFYYDDRGNQWRTCRVSMTCMDSLYRQYKQNGYKDFPPLVRYNPIKDNNATAGAQASMEVVSVDTELVTTEVVDTETGEIRILNVPVTQLVQPEALAPTVPTDAHLNVFADALIDELQGQREISLQLPKFEVTRKERAAAKELAEIIAGGTMHNFLDRLAQRVQTWADAAKTNPFLAQRFFPAGISSGLFNMFEQGAQVKANEQKSQTYPLTDRDGNPTTTTNGIPFPQAGDLSNETIKLFFKSKIHAKDKDKEYRNTNGRLFDSYLKAKGWKWDNQYQGWVLLK